MKNILATVLISAALSSANAADKTVQIQNNTNTSTDTILNTPTPKNNRINLAHGIPEVAKKFGITEEMVQLLGKYNLVALFSPAGKNKYGSSNDRITIVDIQGDYISFITDTDETKKTSSIDLPSDTDGNPIDQNIVIKETRKNGNTSLYIERVDFKQWIPQKK